MTGCRLDAPAAFTLIELLTVLPVVGILASVAVPACLNYRLDAVNAPVKAVIALIKDTANRLRLKVSAASGGREPAPRSCYWSFATLVLAGLAASGSHPMLAPLSVARGQASGSGPPSLIKRLGSIPGTYASSITGLPPTVFIQCG
jgi:prepilin-type N-terminal cleavage/methylation domain-containing protein